ncbi:MAG: hypothetical protein QNJ16_05190 [Rhodobacter sp.]|nr:hypothetical protein [Rhodobacter sp.]
MMRQLCLSAAIGAALAAPAAALTAQGCAEATVTPWGWEDRHRDLGHGSAFFEEWAVAQSVQYTRSVLIHCASGQALVAFSGTNDLNGKLDYVAAQDAVLQVFQAAADAPEVVTFADIAGELAGIEIDSRVEVPEAETCACALFYPDQRGPRPAFEAAQ